jgi:cytochrome c-type biogenesis protein CcmE
MRHVEPAPGMLPKIAISAALIALATAVAHLAPEPRPPYMMVDEVAIRPVPWDGERVRLHGWIKAGTIIHVGSDLHAFTLQRNGQAMRVWYRGQVPDTFRDQSEAIVLGTVLREDGTWWLSATEVMTKCGGKYDGGSRNRNTKFE